MSHEVLILNSDYEPLNVCNLRRAVILLYLGKADVLHQHGEADTPALVTEEAWLWPRRRSCACVTMSNGPCLS